MKKEDKYNKKLYEKKMKRVGLNFFGHFIFFGFLCANSIFLFKKNDIKNLFKFYNIIYTLSLNIISYTFFADDRIIDFIKKIIGQCLNFEKEENEKYKEDEEEENEDEDNDSENYSIVKVYID